jgi:F0F1-type ATP synthase delta subunit
MSLSRKIATLIVEERTTVDTVTALFAKYHMTSLLPSIKEAVAQVSSTTSKKNVIEIESPFPLSQDAIRKVKRIVGNDIAEYEVTINKNVLAGFKARFRGILYDGSAERIIKQMMDSH